MIYDIIIVGCGTAGMTAAIYAKRAGMSVLLIEGSSVGGQIAMSPKISNFPSVAEIDGVTFSDNLFAQAESFGTEFAFEPVQSVSKGNGIFKVMTDCSEHLSYSVILATGLTHRKLGITNEDELTGNGISYCAVCDGIFYEGKDVAVVGGGNSAFQEALYLSDICSKVYLIHRRSEFRADQLLVDDLHKKSNVLFCTPDVITSLNSADGVLKSITIENTDKNTISEIEIDCLFVAIGTIPQTDKYHSDVMLDEKGFIVAGEDCSTSIEGIFAAGDCRTKKVRQLTTAVADGAAAALSAADYVRSIKQ